MTRCAGLRPLERRGRTRAGDRCWLFVCCALVFAMVVVGGVTRLTHSGLSITSGSPRRHAAAATADAWQEAFAKYQATPEISPGYHGMGLAEFKGNLLVGVRAPAARPCDRPRLHRALRRVPRAPADSAGSRARCFGLFVLGGLQARSGGYMVAERPRRRPARVAFRLAAHLALAFAIFAAMLWVALSLVMPERSNGRSRPRRAACAATRLPC